MVACSVFAHFVRAAEARFHCASPLPVRQRVTGIPATGSRQFSSFAATPRVQIGAHEVLQVRTGHLRETGEMERHRRV